MQKEFAVGKAQQKVLSALGMEAANHAEAEGIFAGLHIVVIAVRQGRTSVPHVGLTTRGMTGDDFYESVLKNLVQWMDESDAKLFQVPADATLATTLGKSVVASAKQDVARGRYQTLIPGAYSPEELAARPRFLEQCLDADYPDYEDYERRLYKETWFKEYTEAYNDYFGGDCD